MADEERFLNIQAPSESGEANTFFQGLDRLNQGMQHLAIGRAMQDAQQNVDQINDNLTDEKERYVATRQVANRLAMQMGQIGAKPADIDAAMNGFSVQPTQFESAMQQGQQKQNFEQSMETQRETNENAMLDKKLAAEKDMYAVKQKVPATLLNKLEPLQAGIDASDSILKIAQEDPEYFEKAVGVQNALGLGSLKASGAMTKAMNFLRSKSDADAANVDQERFTTIYNKLQRGTATMENAIGGARAVSNAAVQNRFQEIHGGITDSGTALATRVIETKNAMVDQARIHIQDAIDGGYPKAANLPMPQRETRDAAAIFNSGKAARITSDAGGASKQPYKPGFAPWGK